MDRLVARVSGKLEKGGYRSKVVTIARVFGITGSIQNLPDGRVKVIAEGEEADLERFAKALEMRNAIIDVTGIEKEYSTPTGEYEGFYRLVGEDETDDWLDEWLKHLKELLDVTRDGFNRMEKVFSRLEDMDGTKVRRSGERAGSDTQQAGRNHRRASSLNSGVINNHGPTDSEKFDT